MERQLAPQITINSKVRFGKPVIQGTRTPVDLIVGKIAGGMGFDEVTHEYDLSKDQVRAALQYAAHLVAIEEVAYA